MIESYSNNPNKTNGKQKEDQRFEERSQEYQQAKIQVTKTSMPSLLKETQLLLTCPSRKSYVQMAMSVSFKITIKNAWMEVTGNSQKQKANTSQKIEPKKEG